MTQTELESGINTELTGVTAIDGANIASPSPVDLQGQAVSKNATDKTVSSQTIVGQNVDAVESVSYDQITVETEVTNESLNRTAETLKTSINAILSSLTTNLNNVLGSQSTNVTNAIALVVGDVNAKLSALKIESDSSIDSINAGFTSIIAGVNEALEDIRVKNLEQSNNVATQINGAMSQAEARDVVLKTALDEVIARVQSLDDVYGTDADIAEKIARLEGFLATLEDADLSIVDAIRGTVQEVNSMKRVEAKHMSMNTASGTFPVNLVAAGFPEAILPDDYTVKVEVINNPYVDVKVDAKDEVGFNLVAFNLKTFGRVPVDTSVTPVKVAVSVVYGKLNPLTFDVDVLDDAFLTDGNGTDTVQA